MPLVVYSGMLAERASNVPNWNEDGFDDPAIHGTVLLVTRERTKIGLGESATHELRARLWLMDKLFREYDWSWIQNVSLTLTLAATREMVKNPSEKVISRWRSPSEVSFRRRQKQ